MKVLFDHPVPFLLAHGGLQLQIERTRHALETIGIEVEPLRWWDDAQQGDLIHYFGRPSGLYVNLARAKKLPVVMAELLGGLGARPPLVRLLQKGVMNAARLLLPSGFADRLAWETYQQAHACIALTPWEAHLMRTMFHAPADRVFCVPNGVEDCFFLKGNTVRGQWLVCTATITAVKRVVELAEAAVCAGTPVWILGKPFDDSHPYVTRFLALVRQHPAVLRYEGPVADRQALARIYQEARGFVLLSAWESLSLSALEAAAAGCPLLLSDLPWARWVFGEQASYCPLTRSAHMTGRILRQFYDAAPTLPIPPAPLSWSQVAMKLKDIYEHVQSCRRRG